MKVERRAFTQAEVVDQLRELGVQIGGVLLVHSSFRAVRPIEGGPTGLIGALIEALGPEGTLVMPSWTGNDEEVFDPLVTPCSSDLGVTADTFWRRNGVRRSQHPFAFAARGPMAPFIVQDLIALPPHQYGSPVGRVLDCDGQILLLGVDHDANTSIHMAELMANVPYRRPKHITVGHGGTAVRVDYSENDHCCQLFCQTNDWLDEKGLQANGEVAHAHAKLTKSTDLVSTVTGKLTEDRFVFLHPNDSDCAECMDAWRSVAQWQRGVGPA